MTIWPELIRNNGYLNTEFYRLMKLNPNRKAKKILHQYGGIACNQFGGYYYIEFMTKENYPVKELLEENQKICGSGWGNVAPPGTEDRLSKLLGIEVIEAQEGLFKLANGSYIALENCD